MWSRDLGMINRVDLGSEIATLESVTGIPLLGNLSLDWEFQQRLGENLGN